MFRLFGRPNQVAEPPRASAPVTENSVGKAGSNPNSADPSALNEDLRLLDVPGESSQEQELSLLAEQMLDQGRYALLLRVQLAEHLTAEQHWRVWERFDDQMAVVPEGSVQLFDRGGDELDDPGRATNVWVEALFLDRYAVTNQDFQAFVDAGAYEQPALWAPEILTGITDFVDQTGYPGPRFWVEGRGPEDRDQHPVVGVSWYEADAYARWIGKRLPQDAEWVKAASWPISGSDLPVQRRYPWGNSMDDKRTNLWAARHKDTVPVQWYGKGASVGGNYQLTGNVWEWTASEFGCWDRPRRLELHEPLFSLRGGAYDTYFDRQATCRFQSGDSPVARRHNVGFRCAVSYCDVLIPADGPGETTAPASPATGSGGTR